MKQFGAIEQALKKYGDNCYLGCWASGGRSRIISIIRAGDNKTIVAGDKGDFGASFEMVEQKYLKKIKKNEFSLKGVDIPNWQQALFERLDHWVSMGSGYLEARWNTHADVFIVMLHGYDDNINQVIQLAFDKNLFKAVQLAFEAPQVPLEKK